MSAGNFTDSRLHRFSHGMNLECANGSLKTRRTVVRISIIIYHPSSLSFLKPTSFSIQIYLIRPLITKRNFSGRGNNKWRLTVNTNKIFPGTLSLAINSKYLIPSSCLANQARVLQNFLWAMDWHFKS